MKKFLLALSLVASTSFTHAEVGHLFNKEVNNNVVSYKNITATSIKSFIRQGNITRELLTQKFGQTFTKTDIDQQESWFYGFNIKDNNKVHKCLVSFSFENGEQKVATVDTNSPKCENTLSKS